MAPPAALTFGPTKTTPCRQGAEQDAGNVPMLETPKLRPACDCAGFVLRAGSATVAGWTKSSCNMVILATSILKHAVLARDGNGVCSI